MIVIPMHVREDLMRALDAAHDALRGVDASDVTAPPPPPVVDRVGNAVVAGITGGGMAHRVTVPSRRIFRCNCMMP